MKKLIILFLSVILSVFVLSCSNKTEILETTLDIYATTEEETTMTLEPQKVDLYVFVDEDLKDLFIDIKENYENINNNINIIYDFDSAENLRDKIVNISDCDVFVTNDTNIIDSIDMTKGTSSNVEMLDFVDNSTRNTIFKTIDGNPLYDNCEASIIRTGFNIDEGKKFITYLMDFEAE